MLPSQKLDEVLKTSVRAALGWNKCCILGLLFRGCCLGGLSCRLSASNCKGLGNDLFGIFLNETALFLWVPTHSLRTSVRKTYSLIPLIPSGSSILCSEVVPPPRQMYVCVYLCCSAPQKKQWREAPTGHGCVPATLSPLSCVVDVVASVLCVVCVCNLFLCFPHSNIHVKYDLPCERNPPIKRKRVSCVGVFFGHPPPDNGAGLPLPR